jgi:imidazolonepropionase-like amidohydrolase
MGTDSYSSNWQLSIPKEMQCLLKHSSFTEEQVLQMATSNGAKALQWDKDLGSFEIGKTPGVVLLENNFETAVRIL